MRGRTRLPALAVVAVTATVLSSCGSESATPTSAAPTTSPTSTTSTIDPAAAADAPLPTVRLEDLGLEVDQPVDLTFRPGGTSLLLAERSGRVREVVVEGDTHRLVPDPVLDLSERVGSTDAERGLLGIAVSPDGSELYTSYTESSAGDSRVDAYPIGGDEGALRADVDGRRELVAIEQPFANHNGGSLAMGPDGMLYAGFGDGGAANDPGGRAQDLSEQLGKVLRLDPTGRDDADGDGFPDDNPDLGGAPGIWLSGVRNPWRISFDAETGDLWIGDVGQDAVEEIDLLDADDGGGRGANLGWDLFEGDRPFELTGDPPADLVEPVFTYTRDDGGCSVTGGVVYRGSAIPELDGSYLFGDFCDPRVRALRPAGEGGYEPVDLGVEVPGLVSFGTGASGEVYVLGLDGTIARIVRG
ncbi:MAG: PQQ-dependent sugar dehydrogenase [Microthrixaceae bacterium]